RKLRQVGLDIAPFCSKLNDRRWLIRIDKFQIEPCTPGTVIRSHGVRVPRNSPIGGGFVAHVCQTGSESVLWSNTPDGHVHWLASEQLFGAVGKFCDVKATGLQLVKLGRVIHSCIA